MDEYTSKASDIAIQHGVQVSGWFGEGTIIGDGREWDQVRFNAFPSKVHSGCSARPSKTKLKEHREPAISDTLIVERYSIRLTSP